MRRLFLHTNKILKDKVKQSALLAVLSFVLIVVGSSSVSALELSQESLEITDKSSTTIVHNAGIGDLRITPNLEFNRLDDFISYKLVIKNNDGKKYQIVGITDDNANEAITLTYSYPSGMDISNKEIEFTVKYVKISDSPLKTINAVIKVVDEDDTSADIPIVIPNTGLNTALDTVSAATIQSTIIYIIFAAGCLAIYIIVRRKKMEKNKRVDLRGPKALLVLALLIGVVPVAVIATSFENIYFTINLTDVKINGPYVITFDTDDGSAIPSQIVNNGDLITKPSPKPSKEGYDFVDWIDENGDPYDFDAPVTGPVTLGAKWTPTTYTIAYDLDGGSVATVNPTTYDIETASFTLNNPSKEGHDFIGWTGTDLTEATKTVTISAGSMGNRSYTATWTKKKYTATFKDGDTVIATQTKEYEELFAAPTEPTKTGYNFIEWQLNGTAYDFSTPATSNIELEAVWEKKEYTVSFNTNGGMPEPADQKIKYQELATKPTDPTKEHYIFSKWVDENGNEFDFSTPITDDIELVAEWEKEKYTVTYNSNGGSAVASQTVEYQDKFTKPFDPTRTGYRFINWLDGNSNIYDFSAEATKDITLIAEWQIINYTITYNLNDGIVEGTNPTTYNVESSDITLINPTKEGSTLLGGLIKYEFAGWTGSNGSTPQKEVVIPTGTTGNKNYTANFDTLYKAMFHLSNPGSIDMTEKFVVEGTAIGTLPVVTPDEGYEFKGWAVSDINVTDAPADETYIMVSPANFTAIIDPIEYTVTLDVNDGEYSGTTSATYNIKTSLTVWDPASDPEPTRAGYKFVGWTGPNISDPTKAKIEIPVGSMGDKTYTAKWAELFTVTFDSDGGSSVASQEVADGETATRPEDPTKTDYVVKYWMDANGNEFDFSTPITSDITLTAKWIPAVATIAPVDTGSDNNINLKMKQISNPGETITNGYKFKDTVVTAFVRAKDEDYEAMGSSLTSDNIVSDSSSLAPVYMWFDDTTGTMYWYTEAAKVKFVGTMGRLFAKFDALTDIDSFADFDTSDVTDMNRIFQDCRSLKDTIDPETNEVTKAVLAPIANWDVSSVKSFVFAFGSGADGDAPQISSFSPISEWQVGACEDFNQMFKYNRVLTNLDAFKGWDMTSATNIKNMFTGNTALVDASGLKDWNVINVTTSGFNNVFSSSPIRFQGNTDVLPQFTKRPGRWDTTATTVNGRYIPNS